MSDNSSSGDPMRAAQKAMRPAQGRRFYATVSTAPVESGFALRLDGRSARTPARHPLRLPTLALAELVAHEWAGQGEIVDPATMPVTRIANSAIDGGATTMAETRAEIAAFAGSDLLCYRADAPESLVEAEASAYDPVLDWVRETYGAKFVVAKGVVHVRQPETALAPIRAELQAIEDPFALTALGVMTTLTGSALLAFAVYRGRLTAREAWGAAHVGEDFQIARWGEDEEAKARRASRWREMKGAANVLAALGA